MAASKKLLPICVDDKYGYIDFRGEVVVPCNYSYASEFSEGIAVIRPSFNSEDIDSQEWICIDDELREIGRLICSSCGVFSDGLMAFERGGKSGYVDKTLNVVIPPTYSIARNFVDGLTTVEMATGQTWGAINRMGGWEIPPEYQYLWSFKHGERLTAFSRDRRTWGLLDRQGNVVVEPKFCSLGWPSKGILSARALIEDEFMDGVIDEAGDWVIRPQFEDCDGGYSEDLMSAAVGGKWGLINRQGDWVIRPTYTNARQFSEGLCGVYVNGKRNLDYCLVGGKYGFINKLGETVIEPQFDDVDEFNCGVAEVCIFDGDSSDMLGRRGYVDTQGRFIWEPTR